MQGPDSFDVFPNPVDSIGRVAAQDITSESITKALRFGESIIAYGHLINIEYVIFVCVAYYIIVKRVPGLKTNSVNRRNILLFVLTIFFGFVGHVWRNVPILNCFVTGSLVFGFYEIIFKKMATLIEKTGLVKLPEWYIEEVQEEKLRDIEQLEAIKKMRQRPE